VFGDDYRARLGPGGAEVLDDALAHADTFFTQELPALLRWPFTTELDLPGASHLLHLENPSGAAEAMATFFARPPIATADATVR
jgi:pimeloyl-ACP methyl ester carboxylesterase